MHNPVATYRIQFHKDFTFTDVEPVIPYLDKLGVRTVYASPIFEATPGSTHGYDSVNPHRVNPEIGTETQLRAISHQLTERGMGWLQDIVPNHMAFDPANAWLMDVLEKGQLSRYALFFDILWTSPVHNGRLMVPFLGSSLADVIGKREVSVEYQAQKFVLAYFDTLYPLHPGSYATVLRAGAGGLPEGIEKLLIRLTDIQKLTDIKAYALLVAGFQAELAALLETAPARAYLESCLIAVNRNTGLLQQLADEQVYELCSHEETDQRINYRRFFTVNGLICLNAQEPAVFDHFHEWIKTLLDARVFQGVRIDHIDGLYDPSRYLDQLRELAGSETYIVVEKILQSDEALPQNWPIQGETGYSYLSMVNNLFTNNGSGPIFTRFYNELLGEKMSIRMELLDKKGYILDEHMGGELTNLYHLFVDLNLADAETLAVLTPETLKAGIAEFLIQCPVYRYYGNLLPLSEEEAIALRVIFSRIRRGKPDLTPVADLLETIFLVKPQTGDVDYNDRALRFYQRCMQFTGPLMAKGFEDTLMYTYHRFIGHGEVGDSPEFFGMTTATFHQKMIDRQANWPLALNATSTHDTKRGEDVRSRLNVLTDLADEWIAEVKVWQQLNQTGNVTSMETASGVATSGGDTVGADISGRATDAMEVLSGEAPDVATPDANDEYFIYQTLVGAYPMPGQDEDDFPNRLAEYLQKALREAKRYSTWNNPDVDYEAATQQFAARLLDQKQPFWARFQAFHRQVADFGIVNSLAQVVLKCTCPGLPDIYQGCEGWDLSLVDPDNRRPIDYGQRQQWLDELIARKDDTKALWPALWQHRYDARIKLWLTHTLLNERAGDPDLFADGDYVPLTVEGTHKQHVFAFARRLNRRWCVVAVPLGLARLCRTQQTDVSAPDWADTRIMLPADAPTTWEHRLTGTNGSVENDGSIPVGTIFGAIPLAVLTMEKPDSARNAGILMHITSLPTDFGVGDFGPSARAFADFLGRSRQTYWQLLPLNPVESGQGHSPYSSNSSMAGSPLLLSPELLMQQGLVTAGDVEEAKLDSTDQVDFKAVSQVKNFLFDKAYERFRSVASTTQQQHLEQFCQREAYWLDDFSVFVVLKEQHGGAAWFQWPDDYKLRQSDALKTFTEQHAEAIDKVKWLQFMFAEQWQALKLYCNRRGIRLFGDLPFYLSYDSADVWAHTDIFSVDQDGNMLGVAGVPPDYFNADGQLWGMPVFRWEVLKKQEYAWWIQRLRKNMELYDLLRLDHFRAFADYWEVPASEKTAVNGVWKPGPGADFFRAVQREFPDMPFVAEDLGEITEAVYDLRDEFELPGMKVVQFGFGDSMPHTVNVPHNHTVNAIAYTGTHDNNTSRGWYRQDPDHADSNRLAQYIGRAVSENDVHLVLGRLVYGSVAKTAILPVQDVLGLDETARMNTPAAPGNHWGWRLLPGQLTPAIEAQLRKWADMYNR